MSETIYEVPVCKIDGSESTLGKYQGDVLPIVNVASKCGHALQYEGLEQLYERYRDRAFQALGFPANDFLGQEPGNGEEIQRFCTTRFNVQIPMFSKITVTGHKSLYFLSYG